ncbi:MAG: ester cyclase [Candidatus Dormibacteraeota bacterium]|nr:ester cyclase [Candidatus Dormibacteraeota bacterium]
MADVESNKAVVREHFKALASGDFSDLERIHHPDGRNHAPASFDLSDWPSEGKPFGPEEAKATFEWLRVGFPDLMVTIEDLISEDDRVVARIRLVGTQTGSVGPLPPSGRKTDVEHIHIFRLDGGRIIEHWAVREDLKGMLQTGVISPPGPSRQAKPAAPTT